MNEARTRIVLLIENGKQESNPKVATQLFIEANILARSEAAAAAESWNELAAQAMREAQDVFEEMQWDQGEKKRTIKAEGIGHAHVSKDYVRVNYPNGVFEKMFSGDTPWAIRQRRWLNKYKTAKDVVGGFRITKAK